MKRLLVAWALLAAACSRVDAGRMYCVESTESGHCRAARVSIAVLLDQKDAFHGKRVKVAGYVHFEHENRGIYPTRSDRDEWRSKRGLWLASAVPAMGPTDQLVEVEGTFDRNNTGHLGNWAGAMTHVFRIKQIERSEQHAD